MSKEMALFPISSELLKKSIEFGGVMNIFAGDVIG